jgi:hypothetical protein
MHIILSAQPARTREICPQRTLHGVGPRTSLPFQLLAAGRRDLEGLLSQPCGFLVAVAICGVAGDRLAGEGHGPGFRPG